MHGMLVHIWFSKGPEEMWLATLSMTIPEVGGDNHRGDQCLSVVSRSQAKGEAL